MAVVICEHDPDVQCSLLRRRAFTGKHGLLTIICSSWAPAGPPSLLRSATGNLNLFGLRCSIADILSRERSYSTKAWKFTYTHEAFVIEQDDEGSRLAEICCKIGISATTYFHWKKKYAGLMPKEMQPLPELQDENGSLKKTVAGPDAGSRNVASCH